MLEVIPERNKLFCRSQWLLKVLSQKKSGGVLGANPGKGENFCANFA
jgi:hypothetical protein